LKKPTIKEIADLAKVSIATVSMVINNRDSKISPATRQKVIEVANRLNYQSLKPIRRPLPGKGPGIIGLVIPSISNPYFASIAQGVEEVAQSMEFGVLVCSTYNKPAQELFYINLLIKKRVDGILLASVVGDNICRILNHHCVRVASFHKYSNLTDADFFVADSVRGSYMATAHLLDLGHRNIAYIGKNTNRVEGYEMALRERGCYDSSLVFVEHKKIDVVIGEEIVDLGFSFTKKVLASHPEVTAIFAYNDLAALGAMMAIKEEGRTIPGDISLIGYDDISYAAMADPPLTTVAQPKYERGRDATLKIIERIHHPREENVFIAYRPKLILRNSTGALTARKMNG
jgi:LacI family transcriptional regulator